jgi:hypothetical protein
MPPLFVSVVASSKIYRSAVRFLHVQLALGQATPQRSCLAAPSGLAGLLWANIGAKKMQIGTAVSFITRNVQRIFPPALIACGLGLTAAWVLYLGYGILQLLDLVV